MTAPLTIRLERVHDVLDEHGPAPGERRVLVDRLWPRGVKKERLAHDEWDKDVTPSTALRTAFHHGELDFEEFAARYRQELETGDAAGELLERTRQAGASTLVLLYAAKDTAHNHAQVLRDVLEEHGR